MADTHAEALVRGEGYAVGSLDALGDGPGFRKVRQALGVEAFGVNAIVLPPGGAGRPHRHERQEELYFVHSGTVRIAFADGSTFDLRAGGLARVAASTGRTISNPGDDEAVVFVVGGEGGYVGRDGVILGERDS